MRLTIIIVTVILITSCAIVNNTGYVPEKFIVKEEIKKCKYNYYVNSKLDTLYHKRDIVDVNDTLEFKQIINTKYYRIIK